MTNHAQEAEDLLKPLQALTGKDAAFDLELAQAHATLALAEQQRAANLITVLADKRKDAVASQEHGEDYYELSDRLTPQIIAILGITEES